VSRPAVFAPRARHDLLGAVRWIAKDNKTAAKGLRNAVVKAAARIGDHPRIAPARLELAAESIRFMTLTGYPYILVYDANRDPPLILRVLHGARDIPAVLEKSAPKRQTR
jgi:toxin ParE1/3/4